jgi:hypothetical protein
VAGVNPGPDVAHLASYRSAEGAANGWRKLTDSYSSVLYFTPVVREVDLPGKGRYFRLYADGDAELMTSLCQNLKQRKLYCKLQKRDTLK